MHNGHLTRFFLTLSIALLGWAPPSIALESVETQCVRQAVEAVAGSPATPLEKEQTRALELLAKRKRSIAHPEIADVSRVSIVKRPPIAGWDKELPLSAGLSDPALERARELHLVEDYKPLSDLAPRKDMNELDCLRLKAAWEQARKSGQVEKERTLLKDYIARTYSAPVELTPVNELAPALWSVTHPDPKVRAAFKYTEDTWSKLLREPHPAAGGSLLATPYPVLIPAGRFQESYYWDSYFANKGLLATDRLEVAEMQVENFLSWIRRYGFVPNGGRDYYLSRSQPPFISSMVREVYEAAYAKAATAAEKERLDRWLRERAYPLVRADYEKFWMNPKTHYDPKTGLNHHWDDINLPRPERHSSDNELALGKTYRDTRSSAESGLDFTDAFGNEASAVAMPLLNSLLFKTEEDLVWAAERLKLPADARKFKAAAAKRRAAINRHLWNPEKGRFEPLRLSSGKRVDVTSADTFAPLFVGLADAKQAARIKETLTTLEKPGGLMASNLNTTHQWDGPNGWAPYQVMAIHGLNRYGYSADAHRLAEKWVNALATIHDRDKTFYERIDVIKVSKPVVDESKYPPQEGFLWTNGSFAWALHEVLGAPLVPIKP